MTDIHTLDDRRLHCASDTELLARDRPGGPGWRWGASTEQCPFWTGADEVTR